MKKVLLCLPDAHDLWLREEARRTERSLSEVIRRLIEEKQDRELWEGDERWRQRR